MTRVGLALALPKVAALPGERSLTRVNPRRLDRVPKTQEAGDRDRGVAG